MEEAADNSTPAKGEVESLSLKQETSATSAEQIIDEVNNAVKRQVDNVVSKVVEDDDLAVKRQKMISESKDEVELTSVGTLAQKPQEEVAEPETESAATAVGNLSPKPQEEVIEEVTNESALENRNLAASCNRCDTTESEKWIPVPRGFICNACFLKETAPKKPEHIFGFDDEGDKVIIVSPDKCINCYWCNITDSVFWRPIPDSPDFICNTCYHKPAFKFPKQSSIPLGEAKVNEDKDTEETQSQTADDASQCSSNRHTPTPEKDLDEEELLPDKEENPLESLKSPPRTRQVRKTTRAKTMKSKKNLAKGRRHAVFKKTPPVKTLPSVASFITSKFVYHKGTYLQIGDIVEIKGEDGKSYYAQLNSFLVDQYGEKSTTITWLVPTERSPMDRSFDPETFVIGPQEDSPRSLNGLHFLMHAPADYFLAKNRAVTNYVPKGAKYFIWTSLGPKALPNEETAVPSATSE